MFCVIAVTILVYFSVSASRIRTVHIVFLHGIFCLHITGYITVSLHCECPWETAGVLQTALINLWWQVLQERASRSWILTVLFMTKLNHRSDLWCPIVPLCVFRVLKYTQRSMELTSNLCWSSLASRSVSAKWPDLQVQMKTADVRCSYMLIFLCSPWQNRSQDFFCSDMALLWLRSSIYNFFCSVNRCYTEL